RRRPPRDGLQKPRMVLAQLLLPFSRDELAERLMIRPIRRLTGPVRQLFEQKGPDSAQEILRHLAPRPARDLAQHRSRQRLAGRREHAEAGQRRSAQRLWQPPQLLPGLLQETLEPPRQALGPPPIRRRAREILAELDGI